jgi:hypothetical protein
VASDRLLAARFEPAARRHYTMSAWLALAAALLALAACQAVPAPVLVPGSTARPVLATPCPACPQVTPISPLTQENIDASARNAQASATADIQNAQALASAKAGTATQAAAIVEEEIGGIALQAQAAATADILRAHALATFNAASSTQGAALTEDSRDASALQAEAAETASVLRAVALATFNSASSTQSSALTQAASEHAQAQLRLRLAAQAATQSAAATGTQQWMSGLVAGTATVLAQGTNLQTQAAAGIAQRLSDQRQAQNQGPINFMWKWGLPAFILAAALLGLWGFGRWLKMHTTRPRALGVAAGAPLVIWERGRGLGGYLPNLLRWLAWFVETRPSGPARDPAIEAALPLAATTNAAEAEAPATQAKV